MNLIGIDIGGTKCAVSLGCADGQGNVKILHKCQKRLTEKRGPEAVLAELLEDVKLCIVQSEEAPKAIGISCGGPLDSKKGLVQSPPNLIGWNDVTDWVKPHGGIVIGYAEAVQLILWRIQQNDRDVLAAVKRVLEKI